jgi:hypothetical protein
MDEPSRAILTPSNRFEVLECQAAIDANYVGRAGHAVSVVRAHLMCWPSTCWAWRQRVRSMRIYLYKEVTSAEPYHSGLDRETIRKDHRVSLPQAATRSRAMTDTLASASVPTDCGGSPIRRWHSNTGSTSAPSSKRRCSMCAWSSRKNGRSWRGVADRRSVKVEEYFLETLTPGRHISVLRQGAAASRAFAKTSVWSPRPGIRTPRYLPMPAASSRFRPIWPTGSATMISDPSQNLARTCPIRFQTGSGSSRTGVTTAGP